jgi:hypothetical protein
VVVSSRAARCSTELHDVAQSGSGPQLSTRAAGDLRFRAAALEFRDRTAVCRAVYALRLPFVAPLGTQLL